MAKKLHEVDIRDRNRLSNAVRYNVHQRRGPHVKINEPAATLHEAAEISDRISAESNGRPCLIYGILPDNTAIFVPKDMVDAARQGVAHAPEPEVFLSRSEIEQLSAVLAGGTKKRANTKEAAIGRFRNIAQTKGLPEGRIADLLKGPFDFASHIVCEFILGRPMTIPQVAEHVAEIATSEPETNPHAASNALIAAATANDPELAAMVKAPAAVEAPATKPAKGDKPAAGKRTAVLEAAQRGELPAAPDFSAETHRRYRAKLAEVAAFAEAGKVDELRNYPINPIASSSKALDKYRNLCVIALDARAAANA